MSKKDQVYLKCKDFSVSGELFDLIYNESTDMLETAPQPKATDLMKYYESEDYISHTDSKTSLIDKIYQVVRKYTLKRKLNLINSLDSREKKILDVGCGTGDFLVTCQRNGWTTHGLEPNKNARQLAGSKLNSFGKAQLFSGLKKVSETYDIISLWHVLEHVPDLTAELNFLEKQLAPGGSIIVAVPNYKSYDANFYKEYWAAYDVPRHLWHFSMGSIEKLFLGQGMKIQKSYPMIFDSFYVSLLSEKNKNGKSNFLKAFWIGLVSNLKAWNTKEYSSRIYVIKRAE